MNGGRWKILENTSEVLAVHATLLHTGHILYFGGNEYNPEQKDNNDIDKSRLFDCITNQVSVIGSPTTDVFCSGHALLSDGRVLVGGGLETYVKPGDHPHTTVDPGLRDTWIFNSLNSILFGSTIVAMSGFYSDIEQRNHLIVCTNDGDVHRIWWKSGQAFVEGHDVLQHLHLHDIVGVAGFYSDDDQRHRVIVGTVDGKVTEMDWKTGQPFHVDNFQLPVSFGTNEIVGVAGFYSNHDKLSHVIVGTITGKLHEIWWQAGIEDHADLPVQFNAEEIVGVAGFYSNHDKLNHALVATSDGKIVEIIWKSGQVGIEGHGDVTGIQYRGGGIAGLYNPDEKRQTIIVIGRHGRLQLFWRSGQGGIEGHADLPVQFDTNTGITGFYSKDDQCFHVFADNFVGSIDEIRLKSGQTRIETHNELCESPPNWTKTASMNLEPGSSKVNTGGRWYPTLITVPNGDILAVSGHPAQDDTRHSNNSLEKFSISHQQEGIWTLMNPVGSSTMNHAYPRLHVLPDGNIFCSTPMDSSRKSILIDPKTGHSHEICDCPPDTDYDLWDTTSILLPLLPDNYSPRVLICGSEKPFVIDLASANPSWEPTSPRSLPNSPKRHQLNAVILPTGEIFIFGGIRPTPSEDPEVPNYLDQNSVNEAELYNPFSNEWKTLPPAGVVRNYHSVGLLMADGRVWTAGSSKNHQSGIENKELLIEIFEPSYCFVDRPKIISSPLAVNYEQDFIVETSESNEISRVAVIHPGSVTHSFNSDQRYIGLKFNKDDNFIKVTAPPNRICIPGFYLLFLINNDGVPSEGKSIRIGL